jgi:glycosyltransferase involved in cell wall biosynthesis
MAKQYFYTASNNEAAMRILRFMGYPINNFSTLERMVLAQALKLKEQGHHVEIAFDGIRRSEAANAASNFAPGVPLHFNLPFPVGIRKPILALRYALIASRLIASGKFDIVHVYFEPGATIVNQVARLFPEVKFLRTIGSTPVPRGNRLYLNRMKQRKWVLDLAQMEKIICVGEHIKEMLEMYGIAQDRLVVIPNGIDIEHFRRLKPHVLQSVLRMAFIGRLDPVKNIELLVRGTGLLVNYHGTKDVHLTLYGEGNMRSKLEELAAIERVRDHISFAGQISNVADALNNDIDVYVQASHNEGFGAAVVEAMACEVPVVLSSIRGHQQIALPEVHASYFRADDASDFARCILKARSQYDGLNEQAKRARSHVVSKYSIDAWINNELDVYTEVTRLR